MIRHGQRTTFQERLEITERAAVGQSDPKIAAVLGCSVWTVRKWRRRGHDQGRTGLTSQMGCPSTGRSAPFRLSCAMRSCRCAGRIRVGGRIPSSLNYESIHAGPINPCPLAPESPRCSKPQNSRAAISRIVSCPLHHSNPKVLHTTSANSMPKAACTWPELAKSL
jgi:hypothetical protein